MNPAQTEERVQAWSILRKDDSWTARRGDVTITGTSEEDLREKLRVHVLVPFPSSKAKLRRTWTVTVVEEDGEDEDAYVTSLFD